MAYSAVVVQHRDGTPARGYRVVLEFSAGQTRPVFTDKDGRCVIEHMSVGRAKIYVSGRDYGAFRAPNTAVVVLR